MFLFCINQTDNSKKKLTVKIYAQIEKEDLSIVFGVKTYHNCWFRRKFTLVTDHKLYCPFFDKRKESHL